MAHESADDARPREPIDRLLAPLARFLHVEAAGGVVLLLATLVALAAANSPWATAWQGLWKTSFSVGLGDAVMSHSLKHWINDGLMAVFFFVVGLEVKRELVLGELRDPRRAALPAAAALGGMLVPAGLYLLLQPGGDATRGWGIPMATDIAFVVGCLALLGARVPSGLRVMLLSLAIVDDIGAILVIAVGYTESLGLGALALGLFGIGLVELLARLGVRSFGVYGLLGLGIWLAFHESGIHATIAGVLLGLMTPARPYLEATAAGRALDRVGAILSGASERLGASRVRWVQRAARETVSPVQYLEDLLHPWVAFAIMPLFALANAGVPLQGDALTHPVALAVGAGLVLGKPIGVLVFSFAAVASGVARLPEGVGWAPVAAGGVLTGIGFTMSLFIAGLALEAPALDAAKVGVLLASAAAAVAGMALLSATLRRPGRAA